VVGPTPFSHALMARPDGYGTDEDREAGELAGQILHCKRKVGWGVVEWARLLNFRSFERRSKRSESRHRPPRLPMRDTGFGYSSRRLRKPFIPQAASFESPRRSATSFFRGAAPHAAIHQR
jgi:hypothetical protein